MRITDSRKCVIRNLLNHVNYTENWLPHIVDVLSMLSVVGEAMGEASREFAGDPCSSMKRGAMVRAARGLLSAVTRLLILADMVDVHLLLKSLHSVSRQTSQTFL